MKLIMIYGRMNPIHRGHARMLLETKKRAQTEGAEFRVYLTRTQDSEKNPLSYKDKLRFLRLVVGVKPTDESLNTQDVFNLVETLSEEFSEIEFVVGGDRFDHFNFLFHKYADYFSCPVRVSSFAERHKYPYSATEMRRMAAEGRYEDFMDACPEMFTPTQKIQMFASVSAGLKIPSVGRKRAIVTHSESEE